MRVISGCLRSTPVEWLPVTGAIIPPHLRREKANQDWVEKIKTSTKDTPLNQTYRSFPRSSRLRSRKPFAKSWKEDFCPQNEWRSEWADSAPRGDEDIEDPSRMLPGFETANIMTRVTSNRIRTRHCRTASKMFQWGLNASLNCPHCNGAQQETDHLVLSCPITSFEGGYAAVGDCSEVLSIWIDRHRLPANNGKADRCRRMLARSA